MPNAVEAVGQDMDQKSADELVSGEPHHLLPVAVHNAGIFPTERTVPASALIRRWFEMATPWE